MTVILYYRCPGVCGILMSVQDAVFVCALTGGPGQLPHLAPTYAAVCALCIIGTEQAYESIDRFTNSTFFCFLKYPLI